MSVKREEESPNRDNQAVVDAAAELSLAVDELLNDLQVKFTAVSNEILGKMDDMARRIDSLEASILADQAQYEQAASGTASPKKQ